MNKIEEGNFGTRQSKAHNELDISSDNIDESMESSKGKTNRNEGGHDTSEPNNRFPILMMFFVLWIIYVTVIAKKHRND